MAFQDIVFDIDGTLADATHRLHLIKDPLFWVHLHEGKPLTPDWSRFLSDEEVAKDLPIPQTWAIMDALLLMGHRVLFITGRNEATRAMTTKWLLNYDCPHRKMPASQLTSRYSEPKIYMRKDDDRRLSEDTKRSLLHQARADGYNPTMVFEDRVADTAMWRSEGLLCLQVAEGHY